MAKTKARRIVSYEITEGDRTFTVEIEPLEWLDPEVKVLPDGAAVVGYLADDDDPMNPRTDCDNFGTMICWHSRYTLGDEHDHEEVESLWREIIGDDVFEAIEEKYADEWNQWNTDHPDATYSGKEHQEYLHDNNRRERTAVMEAVDKVAIILPLFLYDHSGITMSTSRTGQYADRWDSSAVGFIYVTHEAALANWSCKTLDDPVDYHDGTIKPCRERALDLLECEVEEYDKFIMNETYTAVVEVFDKDDVRDESLETKQQDCLGTEWAEKCVAEMVEDEYLDRLAAFVIRVVIENVEGGGGNGGQPMTLRQVLDHINTWDATEFKSMFQCDQPDAVNGIERYIKRHSGDKLAREIVD